ncbi:AraC family transcriptional regulator [Pantoea sp. B270]|uniref:AraC family transcriptional regulator n=1 Tax=Pantoea sp. B270 TaxID=2836826 RepID=UPI001BFF1B4F|nr:AraC family transcriptional regulator [Pantoea sp. B270]MBU6518718.1 AraC family transcriptional regulator [Pantoea sp. B270]
MLIHPSDNLPFSGDPRKEELRQRLMRPDAPKVIAVSLSKELDRERRTHRHAAGQLFCLRQGLMTVNTSSGIFANPPRLVGWIPPWFDHALVGPGRVLGWTVLIDEALAAPLPDRPVLLSCPTVLEPLAERLAVLEPELWSSARYTRLGQVFLDELYESTPQELTLPLPEEPRLRQIARLLMDDPADTRTGPELAQWAGLSARSLSRHWSSAVGMSLSKYRQVSRLLKSLEGLAAGHSVQQVAWQVGFDSVSSYISAFRAAFGLTPGKYFTTPADSANAASAG